MRERVVRWCMVWGAAVAATLGIARMTLATESGPTRPEERWYVLEMEGKRAGWLMEKSTPLESGKVKDEMELHLTISRMGQAIEIVMKSGSLESADGRLLELRSAQTLGTQTTMSSYRFEDDEVISATEQFGRTTTKTLPRPSGDWLTPSQVKTLIEQKLAEGATEFVYQTLDASSGLQVSTVKHRVLGRTVVEAEGKTVPAIQWVVTTSVLPGVDTTEYVDDSGSAIRAEVDYGGIMMSVLRSEKEFALAKVDAPELMASALIHPDKPIALPRTVRRAEYIVSSTGDELPELPSTGAQRFERIDATSGRVVVDLDNPSAATEEELRDPRLREASTSADIDDPEIRKLLDDSMKDKRFTDQRAVAEHLTRVVRDYINDKSLGVGFATASEVCRTREGDCSEHAVLLAALIRAAGIPSRVASGVVYVDQFVGERQVFGFHMWAQALVPIDGVGRWIDLDAAVYPVDATHINLALSTLADTDVINSMVPIAGLMGHLKIAVESIGEPAAVPSSP